MRCRGLHRDSGAQKPSAEIAADPARLALWKKQRAEAMADASKVGQAKYPPGNPPW